MSVYLGESQIAPVMNTGGAEETKFIITFFYNEDTEQWEPNCTFVELKAAYLANKEIGADIDNSNADVYPIGACISSLSGDTTSFFAEFYIQWNDFTTDFISYSDYYMWDNGTYELSDRVELRFAPFETVSKTYTPSTSTQTDTITYDKTQGYNALEQVNVTVAAMPSGSVTAPSTISGTSAGVSTGTNTLTLSKTISVTPSVTTAGYVSTGTAGNSSVSLTANVTTKGATTYTPTTSNQTIASGTYLTGTQTISGDSNLIAGNIKKNTTIFGVTGTYEGGSTINNQNKTVNPSTSQQSVTYDSGYTGLDTVTVTAMPSGTAGTPTASKGTVSNHSINITPSVTNTTGYITGGTKTGTAVSVSASELVSGSETKTTNGTYDVTNLAELVVNVSGPTPATLKNIQIPSSQIISGSGDFDEITFDSSSGMVTSTTNATAVVGDFVQTTGTVDSTSTANIIFYNSQSYQVPLQTLPTSTSASATSGYTSKATVSRSTSDQYINIPTGYNTAGAYYKISATPNGTVTAPSTISGTSATVSTGTNTLTLSKTVSVTPNVTTSGYISSGTAGNSAVSLTANITTKDVATITPTTTNQTIASGTYLTGTQTIVGDANLVAENIKKDVQIFNITGTYEASGGGATVKTGETASLSSTVTTVSISGLTGKPLMWALQNEISSGSYFSGATTRYITSCLCDGGSTVYSLCMYKSGSTAREYGYNTCTWSYSNGTITITSPGTSTAGGFRTGSKYRLFYAY